MEESVRNLTLQRDRYLHEIQITYTSLSRIRDALLPLIHHGSLSDKLTHLVRIIVRKNQALVPAWRNLSSSQASFSAIQRGLESLRLENASLTQHLVDFIAANFEVMS